MVPPTSNVLAIVIPLFLLINLATAAVPGVGFSLLGRQITNLNLTTAVTRIATDITLLAREITNSNIASAVAAVKGISGFKMSEQRAIQIVERVMSPVSIVGSLFIVFTFIAFKSLYGKPINRAIFLATWGNIITNVATMISTSGLEAGVQSAVCQTQGFFIQWFMPADSYWQLCIACNVLISFSRQWFSQPIHRMRRNELYYIAFAYGVPFVPAIVYLIMGTRYNHYVYGNATIWCWVTEEWKVLRMTTFYGIVWVMLAATFGIYTYVGFKYIRKSKIDAYRTHSSQRSSDLNRGIGSIVRTDEVSVSNRPNAEPSRDANINHQLTHKPSFTTLQTPTIGGPPSPHVRVQSPVHPPKVQRRSGTAALTTRPTTPAPKTGTHTSITSDPTDVPIIRMNMAQMKSSRNYYYVALVLCVVDLIVWVPSTVNRAWAFSRPPNFALNLTAALVLPLQGLMNCIVYICTNRSQLRAIWRRLDWSVVKSVFGKKWVMAELDGGEVPLRQRRVETRLQEIEDEQEPKPGCSEPVSPV